MLGKFIQRLDLQRHNLHKTQHTWLMLSPSLQLPLVTPGAPLTPGTSGHPGLQNASVSITRCNLLSDIRVTLWLDYPLIIRASFYPESPLCRDYPRCHDLTSVPRAERGVMVSQSEASVQGSLANKRVGMCYKQTFLSWRVNMAKGLEQDRVHYRIQMRGELKIRNVNMGLVTLIRYS